MQHWPRRRRRRTRADSPAEERLGELKRTVARWLMDAGWSSEQVEGFCTVHGESDGGAAGFYWGADGSRDPFWWSGGGGLRLAATFLRNPRRQRAAHPPAGDPEPGADGGAPHGVVPSGARGRRRLDVSRHCHSDGPTSCGGDGGGAEAAEEEAAAEEEELLLGFI